GELDPQHLALLLQGLRAPVVQPVVEPVIAQLGGRFGVTSQHLVQGLPRQLREGRVAHAATLAAQMCLKGLRRRSWPSYHGLRGGVTRARTGADRKGLGVRILYYLHHAVPGGEQISALESAAELVGLRNEVILVAPQGALVESARAYGLDPLTCPDDEVRPSRALVRWLMDLSMEYDPDVIHAFGWVAGVEAF